MALSRTSVTMSVKAAQKALLASLRAQRAKALGVGGIGALKWAECVEIARKDLLKRQKRSKKQRLLSSLKTWSLACPRVCLKGLLVLFIVLLCVGLFLYFCDPASFFLKRKLHSKLYLVTRLARKCILLLDPYLSAVGIDLFGYCLVRNPFVPNNNRCPTINDIKEWTLDGYTVPKHIIAAVKDGEWWILRTAFKIETKVTVQQLNQFSMENAGHLPHICEQIVGCGEESKITALYTDIFNIWKMKEALKATIPWSLSWIECPDQDNTLTLHSLLPPPSYLPPNILTGSMTLMSFSTEWCVSYHYQGKLPSSLLSLAVVKGEVRVVPVRREEDCRREYQAFKERPILLKEGDAALLDYHYWSYEVQTWSNYSFTTTSALLCYE